MIYFVRNCHDTLVNTGTFIQLSPKSIVVIILGWASLYPPLRIFESSFER